VGRAVGANVWSDGAQNVPSPEKPIAHKHETPAVMLPCCLRTHADPVAWPVGSSAIPATWSLI
jgi:hypothetical protein